MVGLAWSLGQAHGGKSARIDRGALRLEVGAVAKVQVVGVTDAHRAITVTVERRADPVQREPAADLRLPTADLVAGPDRWDEVCGRSRVHVTAAYGPFQISISTMVHVEKTDIPRFSSRGGPVIPPSGI